MGTCSRRMKRLGGTDAGREPRQRRLGRKGDRGAGQEHSVASVCSLLPCVRGGLPSQIDEGWFCQICTSYSERIAHARLATLNERETRPRDPAADDQRYVWGYGVSVSPAVDLLARLGWALLVSLARQRPPRVLLVSHVAPTSFHEGHGDAITRLSWPRKMPSDSGAGTALSTRVLTPLDRIPAPERA